MKLIKWVTYASQEVVKSENKVETFLHLRYDEMNKLFPHAPFGNNQVSLSFFDEAIVDLTTPSHLKTDPNSLYEVRYKNWIDSNR